MAAPKDNVSLNSDRIYTGIAGLDVLLGKGVPAGASVIVEGGPGAGKTLFCLSLAINQCKMGRKVLYMSFEEPEGHLESHMKSFNWDSKKYEEKGLLYVKRFSALDVARSVEALLSEAKKELLIEINPVFFPKDFSPDIVIVDSLTSISSAFSGESNRFRIYMEQLFRYFELKNITSFLIREVANPSHTGASNDEGSEAVSFLSDGIIVLYSVIYPNNDRGMGIEVFKLRGTKIEKKIVVMEVTPKGLIVYPDKRVPPVCKLT